MSEPEETKRFPINCNKCNAHGIVNDTKNPGNALPCECVLGIKLDKEFPEFEATKELRGMLLEAGQVILWLMEAHDCLHPEGCFYAKACFGIRQPVADVAKLQVIFENLKMGWMCCKHESKDIEGIKHCAHRKNLMCNVNAPKDYKNCENYEQRPNCVG